MSDADRPNLEIPTPDAPVKRSGAAGGPDFHRDGCKCNACVARRRKAEAIALRSGSDDASTEIQSISPDQVLNDLDVALAQVDTTGAVLVGTDRQRHRVKMWLQWKALEPKLTHAEAASRLGIATQTLTNLLHRAAKAGWLTFENPMDELEYEIIPDANRVVKNALRSGDTDVAVKVSQATIWKQYAASKGVSEAPTTMLALKIEMPEGFTPTGTPNIKGVIVGQPRTIDAEIVKDE